MNLFKGKSTRTKIFAVITIVILLLAVGLNLVLNYFGQKNTVFIDLTYEGFYTLTDKMVEECEFTDKLDEKVEIIFCNDPDRLISNQITRLTYYMSVMLDNTFDNIEMRTVNVTLNPTAVSEYKTTSLTNIEPTDIIIAYGDRYRILGADAFWGRNSDGGLFSYNGEYKMASIMRSVTAYSNAGNATAYFLTDHGETFYDESKPDENRELLDFIHVLEDAGLKIKTLDLNSVERVPDDCAVLIINDPKVDFTPDPDKINNFYYVSPLEKLDRYLIADYGTLMVAKDFERELPLFEEFLYEWGFDFEASLVKDKVKYGAEDDDSEPELTTNLIGNYNTDEAGYGMGIYSEFATMGSAPKYMVTSSGYIKCAYGITDTVIENGTSGTTRIYSPFILSSESSTAYKKDANGEYKLISANEGEKELIGVTTRMQLDSYTNENKYSYVVCANSKEFFTSPFIANSAYSNYEVLVSLAQNTTRADDYASIDLGGTSLNSTSFGGKMLLSDELKYYGEDYYYKDTENPLKYNQGITTPEIVFYSILIFLIPTAIAVVGIIVRVKRKYL